MKIDVNRAKEKALEKHITDKLKGHYIRGLREGVVAFSGTIKDIADKADTHYLMQKGNQVLQLETKADGSYLIAYCQENRTIPNLEAISAVLNKKAEKLDQCRILSQVLDKLISKHRGATESEVSDMMQSFASGRRKPW